MDLLFKNISKHISITENEYVIIRSYFTEKKLERRTYLLQQGEICKYENFILNGVIRTYTIDENGKEHIIMFGQEDWWVGDLYSFLTNKPSDLFIDVLEACDILQITKENLEELYKKQPKMERYFRLLIQNAFISQQQRISQRLSLTAEERYLNFQKKYPSLEQRVSQKNIASYLGITPVFLSLLRKRFAKGKR